MAAPDLIPFHNLTHLEVTVTGFSGVSLVSLDVLECMPNLKVFILELEDDIRWCSPVIVPKCLLSCLEMVQLKGFSASEEEMKIVEYLLKTAMVLEKMTITCYNNYEDRNALMKLLAFSRASSSCQILFSEN